MMKWLSFLILIILSFSCQTDEEIESRYVPALMEIPKGFPDVQAPDGNEFTKARWDLGKRLFFENAMSIDSSISCGSCHQPTIAFSDNVDFSLGVEKQIGTRNSPSLTNVAYHPYFTREGGVPTLEMQVQIPIQEHNEFGFNIVLIAERLQTDASYVKMAKEAYNRELDAFVITRAIACFERSLLSGNSRYDQYVNHNISTALSDVEHSGMNLFFSDKTNCFKCHSDFNFTNYAFENNGLYEEYTDEGRFRLTGEENDRALFKVPSLRNVEFTAPYMHDGSLNSLEEVIDHYNAGGMNHPRKGKHIKSLDLSEQEKDDLLQFLKSLTDETFINNPIFTN